MNAKIIADFHFQPSFDKFLLLLGRYTCVEIRNVDLDGCNNENFPVYIESEETLYWVRKVSRLGKNDTSFLQKLLDEISAFLYHLQHRNLTTQEESRMWFALSLIRTAVCGGVHPRSSIKQRIVSRTHHRRKRADKAHGQHQLQDASQPQSDYAAGQHPRSTFCT